jgi:hypothetical protein
MTWTTLHDKARQLGFKLACHMSAVGDGGSAGLSSLPQHDQSWICVGGYGYMTGLWAQPQTAQARALAPEHGLSPA